MAGKEKMTSVAASPPVRRLSVSGAAKKGREPAFEFPVPRKPRQRASSERSSRSSTPLRGSRGSSPAETRRRPPSRPSSRPSTPQPKKKRNNELERLLISAANDGQRRSTVTEEVKKGAAKKSADSQPGKKKVPLGAKKVLEKAKKSPAKTAVKTVVKSPIGKKKLDVKKKAVQLKKAVGSIKKTDTKSKQAEVKTNGSKSVESQTDFKLVPKKETTLKALKDANKISKENQAVSEAPESLPNTKKDVETPVDSPKPVNDSKLVEPVIDAVLKNQPGKDTTLAKEPENEVGKREEVITLETVLALKDALKESEDVSKTSDEVTKGSLEVVKRDEKPKVDVMHTLTEACRKLEQLTGKKKDLSPFEVNPRSPEVASMSPERPTEKPMEHNVISPVNLQLFMQAKLRNKLSQSPSAEAKEGSTAFPSPAIAPLTAAPIINSLSAAAKQTSSFLKDSSEVPIEYRWKLDKRYSTLSPINSCIKDKVADLLRKDPNEVVLKENKRREPENEDEMEELRISESEGDSNGSSPEKFISKSKREEIERRMEEIYREREGELGKDDEVLASELEPEDNIEASATPTTIKETESDQDQETPDATEATHNEESEKIEECQIETENPESKVELNENMLTCEVTKVDEELEKETEAKVEAEVAVENNEVTQEVDQENEKANNDKKKRYSKSKRESDKKKKKREEYQRKKMEAAAKKAEEEKLASTATADSIVSPEVGSPQPESKAASSSVSEAPSPKANGGPHLDSPESAKEEDLVAKESVLGALGLQSTRVAQQERPKVPKLKLVVRPNPAKKKGHRNETGNEKTYAICHEVEGAEGQKNSHRKKSLWYPGLPISNGELAKLILTTPSISDLIIGRHLGEAKPPQPGIGVGDGLDIEAELGQKGPKKRDEVVIPEKTAASNVHPGRPCEDVCCYCHNKFGLYDTPLHVSQLKGGSEKQSAVLAREPVLTLASCVCDACFRHLDRPLSAVATWRPAQAKQKKPKEASTCCFAGCRQPAPHPLARKWKRRVRGLLTRGLDMKSGLFLCHQHHQETAKIGACVLCGRRAASSQLYCLEPQATDQFNEVLRQDLIPIVVQPEADLCKKCRYYSSLRLRYSDYTKVSVSNRAFLRQHREKIIKNANPSDTSALVEVFPEVSKARKLMPPPPTPSTSSASSSSYVAAMTAAPKRTLLTPSVEIIPVPAEGPPPSKKTRGVAPAKEAVTVRLVGGCSSLSSVPSPAKRPLVKRTARNDGPNLNFQWLGETGPPRGRWHTTRADIQMDDRTLAEWKKRQEPFGSYTSYVKHLITLDGFWRSKQLGPLPGANGACVKYCTSVRNRIEAYEGLAVEPEDSDRPKICDVRSLAE
ncbi:inner centromere protein B isoform X1 [Cloeon dipterum]|uniref:inner centromere protein B isoform X1 n=1 Tax=Cloeon dipterum TaxID=197152 RepID=UPI003220255B